MSVNDNKTNKTDNAKLRRPPHLDPAVKLMNQNMGDLDAFLAQNLLIKERVDSSQIDPDNLIDLDSEDYLNAVKSGYEYYYLAQFDPMCIAWLDDLGYSDYSDSDLFIIKTVHENIDLYIADNPPKCDILFQTIILSTSAADDSMAKRVLLFVRTCNKSEGSWNVSEWEELVTSSFGTAMNAYSLDGRSKKGFVAAGKAGGSLLSTSELYPTIDVNGLSSNYLFTDTQSIMPEGVANRTYDIIQRYYNSSSFFRLAISHATNNVYIQTQANSGKWQMLSKGIRMCSGTMNSSNIIELDLDNEQIDLFDNDILFVNLTNFGESNASTVRLGWVFNNTGYFSQYIKDLDGNNAQFIQLPSTCIFRIKNTGTGYVPTLLNPSPYNSYVKQGESPFLLSYNAAPMPNASGLYTASIYRFMDSNNDIGGGANKEYGIIQMNTLTHNNNIVRLAICASDGKVYSYGNGAWSLLTPIIPIVSSDPVNASNGQLWIRSDLV